MNLCELQIPQKKLELLEKRGYTTVEGLTRCFPNKYYDFTNPVSLSEEFANQTICFVGLIESVEVDKKDGPLYVLAKIRDICSGKKIRVYWFNQYYISKIIKGYGKNQVLVCGKLSFHETYGFSMSNPVAITDEIEQNKKIATVYPKYKNISEEYLLEKIETSLDLSEEVEYLTDSILNKYLIPTVKDALQKKHHPLTIEDTEIAAKRFDFDDLMYFALKLEEMERENPKGSPFTIKTMQVMKNVSDSLPYSLTQDQKTALNKIVVSMKNGRRVNALVQGDVGCGKTIVAFLPMILMAENGYQAALMAPTVVLAKQHFEEIRKMLKPFNIPVAFIGGKQTSKEKKEYLKGIESGHYKIIVGTHGVLSKSVIYKDLSLMITDEEHRFGVIQRESVLEKVKTGVHTVIMSATPIPRSLASTLYKDSLDIFTIKELPLGRKPIKTAVYCNELKIMEFIKKELDQGRQAYVICPLIEKNSSDEDVSSGSVLSIEEVSAAYRLFFNNTPYHIGVVNGKMPQEELDEVISEFVDKKTDILISTTVIEVGVNVPNASVIVINNAERFGLASLHQLRGRVGRGSYQSYCILNSRVSKEESSITKKRLETLCETTDGFVIAEADLSLRGSGDLIGLKQSGKSLFVNLMLENEVLFNSIRKDAALYLDNGIGKLIIKQRELFEI